METLTTTPPLALPLPLSIMLSLSLSFSSTVEINTNWFFCYLFVCRINSRDSLPDSSEVGAGLRLRASFLYICCRVSTMKVLYSEPGSLVHSKINWAYNTRYISLGKEERGAPGSRASIYTVLSIQSQCQVRGHGNTSIQNKTIIIPVCISIHYICGQTAYSALCVSAFYVVFIKPNLVG